MFREQLKSLTTSLKWERGDLFAVEQTEISFGSNRKHELPTRAGMFIRARDGRFLILPMTTTKPGPGQRNKGKWFCLYGNSGDYTPANKPTSFVFRKENTVNAVGCSPKGRVNKKLIDQIDEWLNQTKQIFVYDRQKNE